MNTVFVENFSAASSNLVRGCRVIMSPMQLFQFVMLPLQSMEFALVGLQIVASLML
jgi:hypothetical protein